MTRCFISAFIFASLLGCSMHRPVEVPLPVELPESYQSQADSHTEQQNRAHWWTVFNDERLNALTKELLANNLELVQAFARLQQVESGIKSSGSALFPQVNLGGEARRSMQPGVTGDFTGDTRQFSAAAAYELDLWGKLATREKAAELDYQASKREVETLYLSLTARLADLYFLVVEQRAQLHLTEKTIASFQETADRVERRYRKGLAPAVEMYQAQQSLEAAKASRYLYQARLAEAEHALSILLGRYPDSETSQSPESLPEAPELFATGVPAELLGRRPDLQAALKRIEAADARVAAAVAERLPSISLSGSLGTLRQEITSGLIKGDFWSLLGNLALPVIDGGRRRAEVERQEAQLAEAVAAYQQSVLNAFGDVEDALVNNAATEQRSARLAETARVTAATLRLSTDRYLSGLTDYLPVLTAQRADFEAQRQLLSARRQLLADRISLARALGGEWMQQMVVERIKSEEDNTDEY